MKRCLALGAPAIVAAAFLAVSVAQRARASEPEKASSDCDVVQMRRTFDDGLKSYQTAGQTKEARETFLALLNSGEARCSTSFAYLEVKARYLGFIDEEELRRATFARIPDEVLQDPLEVGNRVRLRYGSDPKAALALLRRLAGADDGSARKTTVRVIHDSLAQNYAPTIKPRQQSEPYVDFLRALADPSSPRLAEITAGLRLWVEAQDAKGSPDRLEAIARRTWDVVAPDARVERYQLLIADLWQQLEPEKARAFRERVLLALESAVDESPKPAPQKVYQAAYGHLRNAQQHGVATAEGREALRKALRFAVTDLQTAFYESVCLGGPRPSEMRGAIADEFEKGGFPEEALAAWTEAALVDPTALSRAHALHAQQHPGQSFETYWEARLPPAPVLDLRTADGTRTSLEALRGHWVLLDFWATWCGPCREEMLHLQELQEQLASPQHPPASILTIACDDQPADAYAFVNDRHFTFPVAVLAERGPEDTCNVGLPTHVLVTPGGRQLSIPMSVAWPDVLRTYVPGT